MRLREVKDLSSKSYSYWRSEMSLDSDLTPKSMLILLHQAQGEWWITDAFHELLSFFSVFQVFMDWWVLWGQAGLGWLSSVLCVISSSSRIARACFNHVDRVPRMEAWNLFWNLCSEPANYHFCPIILAKASPKASMNLRGRKKIPPSVERNRRVT